VLPTKLRIDALYIRSRSIFTDLDVIFMTMACLLPAIRAVNFPRPRCVGDRLRRFVSRFLNWFLLDFIISMLAVWRLGLIWRLDMPLNLGWAMRS
jgi:hypothetical protein